MDNIIYKSDNIIPWDTQSAFKMTNYSGDTDENLIFCYFKSYVKKDALVMCTYTFIEKPAGDGSLTAAFRINGHMAKVTFGYDGISSVTCDGESVSSDGISLNVFRADDEQGFYWCGEITLGSDFIGNVCGCALCEGGSVGMNLIQHFESGEWGAVYCGDDGYENAFGDFLILGY